MTPYRLQATIRRCAAVFLFACVAGSVAAAERSPDGLWQRVAETDIPRAPSTRQILPIQYLTVSLARSQLQARLAQAPLEREVPVARSATVLTLPLPDGEATATSIAYGQIRQGSVSLSDMKRQIERDCIARALDETGGNITKAATLLGMKRPRLSQLVKQYGLSVASEVL